MGGGEGGARCLFVKRFFHNAEQKARAIRSDKQFKLRLSVRFFVLLVVFFFLEARGVFFFFFYSTHSFIMLNKRLQ